MDIPKNSRNHELSDWTLSDLIARYGVCRTKITGDFFGYGLPHYKIGCTYHFSPAAVRAWEIHQQRIPYGQKNYIVLPAYLEYKQCLKTEIKKAKSLGDRKKVAELEQTAKSYNINLNTVQADAICYLIVLSITTAVIITYAIITNLL